MSKATTTPFAPACGEIYRQHNAGKVLCVKSVRGPSQKDAVLINTITGWTFHAHGIRAWPDGSLEWDYSTGGRFAGE